MSNISSINLTFIDAVTVYSISKANAESNHGSCKLCGCGKYFWDIKTLVRILLFQDPNPNTYKICRCGHHCISHYIA